MIRLLLVADDFTGALDSSIFFASKGVSTVVEFSPDFSWEDLTPDAEILAVNSASRHMPAQQAAALCRQRRRNHEQVGEPDVFDPEPEIAVDQMPIALIVDPVEQKSQTVAAAGLRERP